MGNHHSGSYTSHKPRKNVHWKSAGRPAVPGKPEIIPLSSDEEPNAITLKWPASVHDGGAPLQGYQVECNRLGTAAWVRTAPAVVQRPELVLTGLEPPHRYQFRVAAVNAVGRSDHSELSDVLTVSADAHHQEPPLFTQHLEEVTALENDKTEFRVAFTGSPAPTVSWFKDGYEIFSSRRTAITTEDHFSVLVFHQTLASDEGEIKCTVTNRAGHAVSKAHLSLEAAPKLRYPRQYEDGLLFEINETVFLKTTIVGKPAPSIEWRHDGQLIQVDERIQITNTPKFSILKIQSACRSDRGEYQIHARNSIGEDSAAFLVTITAPPEPPRNVSVTRQVDKSVTLTWDPPEDDGGCRIGNYIVEYYRTGWNVWLKATTSRKTNVTLFELIEGSEYRFRVKAESPYGMSAPSAESTPVKIPGRAIDMEFLAVESRIITDVLLREDGEVAPVSPVPRRRRPHPRPDAAAAPAHAAQPPHTPQPMQRASSNEFMLLLCPNDQTNKMDTAEKRKSFQLDLEDALSPPQLSLSAPDLSSRCTFPFKPLRNAVSSTELLHERAMARFYKAVALTEEQDALKQNQKIKINKTSDSSKDIPVNITKRVVENKYVDEEKPPRITVKPPEIIVKNSFNENKVADAKQNTVSNHLENKWQSISFEEDYTASTVSTDGEYSDNDSFIGDLERKVLDDAEEDTYSPRDKFIRPLQDQEQLDENENKKQLPSLEPKFMPKPILKRRDSDTINNKIFIEEQPPKKEKKMTILKKITKMPVQKTFSKILNKKEAEPQVKVEKRNESQVLEKPKEKEEDEMFLDEGKTAIDYYSNIVKEYGGQKKPAAPLYLNTDDLKNVAEKQHQQHLKKKNTNNKEVKQQLNKKSKKANIKSNQVKINPANKNKSENKEIVENNKSLELAESTNESNDKCTQKIVLRKTERATIVIPINYHELEENAKMNVRSAIDYMLDLCLLILAFWAYFFKDERLAIPFLVLIIYRQLKETFFMNIPEWLQRHTPRWLKKIS